MHHVGSPADGSVVWALLSGAKSIEDIDIESAQKLGYEAKVIFTIAEVALGFMALAFLSEFSLVGVVIASLGAALADDGRVVAGRIIEKTSQENPLTESWRRICLTARIIGNLSVERGRESQDLAEIRELTENTWVLRHLVS